MDPLSIVASAASLYALAIQLSAVVNKLISDVKSRPALLKTVAQDLASLQVVLAQFDTKFNSSSGKSPEGNEALIPVFTGCMETLQDINSRLTALQTLFQKSNRFAKLVAEVRFSSMITSISTLRDQLEKYKATLSIALHLRNL
jgi:hypothetical protein